MSTVTVLSGQQIYSVYFQSGNDPNIPVTCKVIAEDFEIAVAKIKAEYPNAVIRSLYNERIGCGSPSRDDILL